MNILFYLNAQSFFYLSDSTFEVGQIKRIEINYQLSGGSFPTIESLPILDSIIYFLKKNESLKIEVGAHTDYRGDSTMNIRVSELRAKSVKDYFIEKGIDINRLEHKAYGKNEPIIVDLKIFKIYSFLPVGQRLTEEYIKKLDTIEKQEIANILNRRTEIKIIEKQ